MTITYTNSTLGSCDKPEEIQGGYWVCYNNTMCILNAEEGMKCRGRVKCVDDEWKEKTGRPKPHCIKKHGALFAVKPLFPDIENYHRTVQILSTAGNSLMFIITILLLFILKKLKMTKYAPANSLRDILTDEPNLTIPSRRNTYV